MKLLNAVSEAILASVAVLSMYSYSLDFLPEPLNSIVLGGGAGLLTATLVISQGKRGRVGSIGAVGALPGMPVESIGKASAAPTKSLEKARILRRYDRAFGHLLLRHAPGSRTENLERMKPLLYELSPDIKAWTGDARVRVYLLMHEIATDLDNPSHVKANLDLLYLILSKGGRTASEMARPIFREKIQEMYGNPKYENERFLPRLLLMLDDYDPARVESLTRDAIHVWGDERFRVSREYLGFEELKERGLRPVIKGLLGEEIARAGTQLDSTALNRAVELYHEVK